MTKSNGAGVSPPDQLLFHAGDYLSRVGSQGCERDWLVNQLGGLGYSEERVSAALALLVADRRARRGTGDAGADVIVGSRAA